VSPLKLDIVLFASFDAIEVTVDDFCASV